MLMSFTDFVNLGATSNQKKLTDLQVAAALLGSMNSDMEAGGEFPIDLTLPPFSEGQR